MSALVIDLGAVRVARDEAVWLGSAPAHRLAEGVAARVMAWAARADAVSGPLATSDPEMARAINRWAARRLRAEVKRLLADFPHEGMADVVASAARGFSAALMTLEDRRARVDEVRKGEGGAA